MNTYKDSGATEQISKLSRFQGSIRVIVHILLLAFELIITTNLTTFELKYISLINIEAAQVPRLIFK